MRREVLTLIPSFPLTTTMVKSNTQNKLYARSDNSLLFECNGARFTNQYVIPYCPQLLLLFNCHLNVEISAGLKTVKYLSKYIYKGPDRATMEISGGMQDKIKAHLDGRYKGTSRVTLSKF